MLTTRGSNPPPLTQVSGMNQKHIFQDILGYWKKNQ
jgi:hypothetical protein